MDQSFAPISFGSASLEDPSSKFGPVLIVGDTIAAQARRGSNSGGDGSTRRARLLRVLDLVPEVRHDSGHILESIRSRCTVASEFPLESTGLGCAEGPLPPEPKSPEWLISLVEPRPESEPRAHVHKQVHRRVHAPVPNSRMPPVAGALWLSPNISRPPVLDFGRMFIGGSEKTRAVVAPAGLR